MPPMEADTTYKDVLHPVSYTVDHLLLSIQAHAILRLHTCYAISRLHKFSDCVESMYFVLTIIVAGYCLHKPSEGLKCLEVMRQKQRNVK